MNCFLKWAISFEEREAPAYDEKAVKEAQKKVFHNWPVQIKLAPVSAPYFIQNKVTLIGFPKLDQVDYSEKLTAIIQNNNIQSVKFHAAAGLRWQQKKHFRIAENSFLGRL